MLLTVLCSLSPAFEGTAQIQTYGKNVKFGKSVTFDTRHGTNTQFQDVSHFTDEDQIA